MSHGHSDEELQVTRNANAGHAGAQGATPRCHTCRHPGGWRRRVVKAKKSCSCECHRPPA